jgi:hypothetical protein
MAAASAAGLFQPDGLALAVSGGRVSLGYPLQPGRGGGGVDDVDHVLGEAHAAYRSGDFTNAFQLCQLVRTLAPVAFRQSHALHVWTGTADCGCVGGRGGV